MILEQDLDIERTIEFSGGLLDLNNEVVSLQPKASLLNESESSRVIGNIGGYVSIKMNLDRSFEANPGNLGAILSSALPLGTVTLKRGHKIQTGFTTDASIQRYFDIEFENDQNPHVQLRFNYVEQELNGKEPNALTVYKSEDRGMHWNMQANAVRNVVPDFSTKDQTVTINRWTLAAADRSKVANSINKSGELRTWPNPASGFFYVQAPVEEDVDIKLFDATGKFYQSLTAKNGSITKITGLPPGSYIIKAEGKTFRGSNRVIVQAGY